MPTISAIVLSKNIAHFITPTLKTLQFVDEIILVDTGSTDDTIEVSRPLVTKIIKTSGHDFAKWRNLAAKEATGDWILYVDSDERIPVELAKEINKVLENPKHSAYTISRQDILLGKHLKHWPDSKVLRLIKKSALKGWQGKLHEQPQVEGSIGEIKTPMIHMTHREINSMVEKTLSWSQLEAEMLYKKNHPPMKPWRFWRILFTEFFKRTKQGLFKDGNQGHIEIIFQMFSRFLTYVQLWQMQKDPSLSETYKQIDNKILDKWQKQK